LVAKVSSDQAKPNGALWVLPGREAAFLAPLDVRKIPGVGKVMEKNLHDLGIRKVGDLARYGEDWLERRFGKWGLALAGKARGADAGGWFDEEIGAGAGPKSISHEHTFSDDTADVALLDATLARLCEMVGRRLREQGVHAHTVQLKLRYSDFTTITRAHSISRPTQLDTDLLEQARALFLNNWKTGAPVRLLGVHTSGFDEAAGQLDLLDEDRHERWKHALEAADKLRDRFGESAVSLAAGLKGNFRERVHENPAGLPGKDKRDPKP
jgi:DNA polymerase-4